MTGGGRFGAGEEEQKSVCRYVKPGRLRGMLRARSAEVDQDFAGAGADAEIGLGSNARRRRVVDSAGELKQESRPCVEQDTAGRVRRESLLLLVASHDDGLAAIAKSAPEPNPSPSDAAFNNLERLPQPLTHGPFHLHRAAERPLAILVNAVGYKVRVTVEPQKIGLRVFEARDD